MKKSKSFKKKDSVVILSAHLNALGAAISLRELGWVGRIVCLKINEDHLAPAELAMSLCECKALCLASPDDIIKAISEIVLSEDLAAIIPTSEQYLPILNAASTRAVFPRATVVCDMREPWETVTNRRMFYDFLQKNCLAKVPETVSSKVLNPFSIFGGPFRTRVWQSWRNLTRLPRGRTIRSQRDLDHWRTECDESHLSVDDWGYQELLSLVPQHNLSVCGWHKGIDKYYRVTRKIAQYNENGWLIEAIDDPGGLCDTASRVLTALDYKGPFELEFVLNREKTKYKVIELNPRLWLQHRICGNSLIGRCVGLNYKKNVSDVSHFWINPFRCLFRGALHRFISLGLIGPAEWAIPARICGTIGTRAFWIKLKQLANKKETTHKKMMSHVDVTQTGLES